MSILVVQFNLLIIKLILTQNIHGSESRIDTSASDAALVRLMQDPSPDAGGKMATAPRMLAVAEHAKGAFHYYWVNRDGSTTH